MPTPKIPINPILARAGMQDGLFVCAHMVLDLKAAGVDLVKRRGANNAGWERLERIRQRAYEEEHRKLEPGQIRKPWTAFVHPKGYDLKPDAHARVMYPEKQAGWSVCEFVSWYEVPGTGTEIQLFEAPGPAPRWAVALNTELSWPLLQAGCEVAVVTEIKNSLQPALIVKAGKCVGVLASYKPLPGDGPMLFGMSPEDGLLARIDKGLNQLEAEALAAEKKELGKE